MIGWALTLLNASQIVATVTLLFLAQRLTLRRLPFILAGVCAVVSIVGLVVMPGTWVLLWSGLIGLCCAFVLTLGLSVPALVTAPEDVHRLSAGIFAISYFCAFLIPTLGGISWDLTGIAATAFLPGSICAVLVVVLGCTLNFSPRSSPL